MATQQDTPEPFSDLAPFLLSEIAESVVRTGASETRCRTAGTGEDVLFLGSHGTSDWTGTLLFTSLATHFRATAPEPAVGAGGKLSRHAAASSLPVCTWLQDVIAGLGLLRPRIVADGVLALATLSFALANSGCLDRIVVVCHDLADCVLPIAAFSEALRQTGHPVLFLRLDAAERSSWDPSPTAEMIDFLAAMPNRHQGA